MDSCTIGSGKHSDVRLVERGVSRVHFNITRIGEQVSITLLGYEVSFDVYLPRLLRASTVFFSADPRATYDVEFFAFLVL